MLEVQVYEALLEQVVQGDKRARDSLVEQLWPFLLTRVRTRKALRTLQRSDDHVHNVVARIVEKLYDADVIAGYVRWKAEATGAHFGNWISTVIEHEVVDYVRQVAGRSPAREVDGEESDISAKLFLNEFATSTLVQELGARPPITAWQQVKQLLEFAEKALPNEQCAALRLWLKGATDAELDEELKLTEGEGRKLMRAAIATLRRRFLDVEA